MIDITKPTFTIDRPIDDLYVRMTSTSGLDGGIITRIWLRIPDDCTHNFGATFTRTGHTHTIFIYRDGPELSAEEGRQPTEIHIAGVPRGYDMFTRSTKGELEAVFVPSCSYGQLSESGIWTGDVVIYPPSSV